MVLAASLQQPAVSFTCCPAKQAGRMGRETSRAGESNPISNSRIKVGAWGSLRKCLSCQARAEVVEELSGR